MDKLPLAGIRVLDFTHEWAGPFSTRILGDFGAEVIKIEYVKRMCPIRGGRLEGKMYNKHPRWHQINRNKLSITLDLNIDCDLRAFKDLVKISDIVVNNSRPCVMEKYGLSYQHLKKLKNNIIFASLSAFGANGPYSSYVGYGVTMDALSGTQSLTAYEKDGKRYRIKEVDVVNGIMGTCAIMTALLYRQKTGQGQYIDLSQMETTTHMLVGEHLLEYVMNGMQTLPLGNRHLKFAPQGCYRCKGDDKWVTITVRTNREWRNFCKILGHFEWMTDSRFATIRNRIKYHDDLDLLIEKWTIIRSHYEVMHLLQKAGIPSGAVLNSAELCQDSHLKERRYFITASNISKSLYLGLLSRLSEGAGQIFRRGPDLGEHNEYVSNSLLGRLNKEVISFHENEIGTAYDPE